MRMTAEEYLAQLQGLLPPGTAWPTTGDATLTQLLGAIAEELARIDARAEWLADEAYPLTCYETLSDWERAYGLPTACMAAIAVESKASWDEITQGGMDAGNTPQDAQSVDLSVYGSITGSLMAVTGDRYDYFKIHYDGSLHLDVLFYDIEGHGSIHVKDTFAIGIYDILSNPFGEAFNDSSIWMDTGMDDDGHNYVSLSLDSDQLIPGTDYFLVLYQDLGGLCQYTVHLGSPLSSQSPTTQTIDQRRAALIARILDKGGQRPADYVSLAAAVGFTVTVTEFRPYTVEDPVDIPILGDDWAYAFQINAPETTVVYFEVDDGVDEPLASWGNRLLECVIRYKSPAHTIPIFVFS